MYESTSLCTYCTHRIVVVVLLYFRKYENNMKVFSYEIKFKSYVRNISTKVCSPTVQ